jgi:hypothetical protein
MYNNYMYTCDKALLGADIERGSKVWLHPRASIDGEATMDQLIGAEVVRRSEGFRESSATVV